jgi:hypothetical protein
MIYAKFYSIDTWRDVMSLALNLTSRKYTEILPGWEGGSPAIFNPIPAEDEIEGLYDIYTGRPVAAPAPSDSSMDSLFGPDKYG